MAILDGIKQRIAKVLNVPQAQGWWWDTGKPATLYEIGANYAGYEKAYKEQVWIHRCIALRAACVASVPLKLYSYQKGKREEITEHSLLRLLDDVNPLTMNASELWIATETAKCVYGDCYWYLERKGGSEPKEIYWLRPRNMTIHGASEPDVFIDYYEYQTGNKKAPKIRYSPKDIIHFKNFNPENEYYGLSPLASIREAISGDLYAQAWNKYFFRNSARLDGFIKVKGRLTDAQREELKRAIYEKYGGVTKAHQIGVLEGDSDWQQISAAPKDAEWNEFRKMCREAICSALGVPPVLVVAYEAATYATAMEQKKSLWHETIIPELHYFEEVLNWNLVSQFEDLKRNARLEFDLTDVPALQEEASERYERLFRAVGAPYLTVNEARTTLGLPTKEGGDVLYVPLNMIEAGKATE